MFKKIVSIVALLGLLSCQITKQPVYKKISNLEVVSMSTKLVVVKADVEFFNPNDIGATVDTDDLALFFNGSKIADAETKPFKAKANKDFAIPITISFPPMQFYEKNKKDFLSNVLNTFTGKKFDVTLKGDLQLKVAGIKFKYPLNETQELALKF